MAECVEPETRGYEFELPQGGEVPIKLYESNKGGRVGSVLMGAEEKLQLCSETIGSVNEIRLPEGIAIELEAGKAEASDGRYWVRSNQIRFTSLSAEAKQFTCERNQVKTRVAGGAAGAESCK